MICAIMDVQKLIIMQLVTLIAPRLALTTTLAEEATGIVCINMQTAVALGILSKIALMVVLMAFVWKIHQKWVIWILSLK